MGTFRLCCFRKYFLIPYTGILEKNSTTIYFIDGLFLLMNSIQRFIIAKKCFSLFLLINAFYEIKKIAENNNDLCISFNEISNAVVKLSSSDVNSEDIKAYAGLLYESITAPCLKFSGPVLCLKSEIIQEGEKVFLNCLEKALKRYEFTSKQDNGNNEDYSFTAEELRKEILRFLMLEDKFDPGQPSRSPVINNNDSVMSVSIFGSPLVPQRKIPVEINDVRSGVSLSHNDIRCQDFKSFNGINGVSFLQQRSQVNFSESVDQNDPITRFLAHIRKSGMDMLFPQVVHDKVRFISLIFALIMLSLIFRSFY
jgi:hypothetical protein